MGRAIVRRPQVFLMDEPLSNLDAKLRVQTRTQISTLQRQLATTTIYVTHDQVEAMTMGDRVAVLRDGVLQQCAAPREVYHDPVNAFVAGFMGSPPMNLFTLPIVNRSVSLGDWIIPVPREIADTAGEVGVGIRPEHLDVDGVGVEIEVEMVEELGSDAFIYGRVVAGPLNTTADEPIIARAHWRNPPEPGTRTHLRPNSGHIQFFANDPTGRRLT
jgi:multiple sugar transport system ATP-binding protein